DPRRRKDPLRVGSSAGGRSAAVLRRERRGSAAPDDRRGRRRSGAAEFQRLARPGARPLSVGRRERRERIVCEAMAAPTAKTKAKTTGGAMPLTLSNPNKVFWPDEGYTKLDLARFYDMVFPMLQPYVEGRLLSLKRCPNGMLGKCFFQKEKPESMPPDTPTKRIVHTNGIRNYVVGGKLETQLALVSLGCIAVHVWGSRAPDPRKPDWVCFDLDPDSGKFADAARAGLRVKEALDALRLASFAKTS